MKKIFGLPIAVFVIGLLAVGGAVASLVSYLSNTSTASVDVKSPVDLTFANLANSNYPLETVGEWTTTLTLPETRGLGESYIGLKLVNNANVAISDKVLKVTMSNAKDDITCDDVTSIKFMDTTTPTEVAKGFQEFSASCTVVGTTTVYTAMLSSLAASTTYQYPMVVTFGNIATTTYSLSAQVMVS